ncbi:MAG: hypothetical protein OQJ96_05930 [Flavobacteriales bacterium]|nr:hypothetical protein [Flavobacteriales bacterium]MCW8937616.1 hypothetical protein [Flavobacteriales bacterium]MCW8968980.1 hypothetical protein [Flavobacteriales bacterium]MCW8990104.1 hypothetical protein [Flavobacteriales bacterium]MCW9019822.1 hypothetical protein [Flavobacteriales bacterium]
MLSRVIKNKIESQFGHQVRYPKDCEALAADIADKTKHYISGSTVKRLFGFVKGTKEPREYTLDVIAEYLGCSCYETLLNELNFTQEEKESIIEEIEISKIREDQTLVLKFGNKEEIKLKLTGKYQLEVIETTTPDLKKGDKILLSKAILHYPLFIKSHIRNEDDLGSCTLCKISGVTLIELE